MREIKFRAWDIKAKKMGVVIALKIEALDSSNALGIGADMVYNEHLDKHADIEPLAVFRRHETFNPECILMQYTGLKDKNGKEIYEGDIVRSANGLIATVEWDDDIDCDRYWRCAVGLMINFENGGVDHADPDRIEVIGNIYENPELLEQEKDV